MLLCVKVIVIKVRRYLIISDCVISPSSFCDQLIKVNVAKTSNVRGGDFFFWVVGSRPDSVYAAFLHVVGKLCWVLYFAWVPVLEFWGVFAFGGVVLERRCCIQRLYIVRRGSLADVRGVVVVLVLGGGIGGS